MAAPEDFARLVVDEQTAFLRRWGDSWATASEEFRRLADGGTDGAAVGRTIVETAARDAVHAVESLGRVGVGYWQLVTELVDVGSRGSATSTSTAA